MRKVVIVSGARTPIGSFQGVLSSLRAPELGSIVIAEAARRAGLAPEDVEEVLMGCVLQAGIGQAPARQAALGARLPSMVPCTTVNKVCGSGLKSVMLGAQAIAAGDADVVVAGGMESMSNVPYYLPDARGGFRLGHSTAKDGIIHDGLWDVYNDFHMGSAAELCAKTYSVSRAEQDAFALESYKRAQRAATEGKFSQEIVAVEVPQKKGPPQRVTIDEEPGRSDLSKVPSLKPAFQKDGTVTAANASKINDGAAAVVLMAEEVAKARGLQPLATIRAQAQAAQAPEWFTTAPATSLKKVVEKAGVDLYDVDLWEINEAFSVVGIINTRLLGLDAERVNVNGGAVALGHPIGASGARLLVTLLHAMAAQQKRLGGVSLCIGGGEAAALLVERTA